MARETDTNTPLSGEAQQLQLRCRSLEEQNAQMQAQISRLLEEAAENQRIHQEKDQILFNDSPVPIFMADRETGIILDCNQAACDLIEKEKSDIIGKHQKTLHPHVDESSRFSPTFEKHLEDPDYLTMETEVITSKGRIRKVQIRPNQITLAGRKVMCGYFHDITKIADYQQQLSEREYNYRTLLENLPGIVYRCELNVPWRMFHISFKVLELTGYTREQFLGGELTWASIVHPDDLAMVDESVISGVQKHQQYEATYRIVHTDGDIKWVREKGMAIYAEDGSPLYLDGFIWDVTEQKRLEEALQYGEKKYRMLFESMNEALAVHEMVYDEEGKAVDYVFLELNPACDFHIGIEHAASLEGMLGSQSHGVSPPPMLAEYAQVAATGFPQTFIYHSEKADRYFSVSAFTPTKGVVATIFENITSRIKSEEKMRETNLYLQNLLDFANAPIIVWDASFRITRFNHAFERLTGFWQEDVIGKNLDILFPNDSREQSMNLIRQTLEGEYWETVDIPILTQDGEVRSVLWNSANVLVSKGQITATIAQGVDITDRIKAEEEKINLERQIQQTQKLESLGVLAGGIAHDFNNLLMAILGYADLALMDLSESSPVRENLEEIIIASRRAADLCRQMLAYSGKGRFIIEPVSLTAIVEEMANLLKTSISKKAILNLDLMADMPVIEADISQIRQIVMNLIVNASEAINEENGVITLRTGVRHCTCEFLARGNGTEDPPEGDYAFVEVKDSGCGMDEHTLAHIFEPFYTTKFMGRGLGLSAVLGIVRSHRGILKVKSVEGKGTTFEIYFPFIRNAKQREILPVSNEIWEGSGAVLFVDDEESIQTIVPRMLEKLGFHVLLAANGEEALEMYKKNIDSIDCVILDLMMPRMDGEECFHELMKINPKLPVILSSGYSEEESNRRFAGKGLAGFVQKPYDLARLRTTLKSVLKKD